MMKFCVSKNHKTQHYKAVKNEESKYAVKKKAREIKTRYRKHI